MTREAEPGLPEVMRYRAFLSYRSVDRKQAEWLHQRLERYRLPRTLVGKAGAHGPVPRRLAPIFRDRDDARSAADLETTITAALARSRHLVVLCTPASAAAESWVPREIEIFRRVRPDGEIHAAIGGGEPPACFPAPLLTRAADGALQVPLAADLRARRHGGDGKAKALVKLAAGIAGVEFDELWRRERRRRAAMRAVAATAVVLILIGAWQALQAREQARLAAIARAAAGVDPNIDGARADLLTIASSPPPWGAIVPMEAPQSETLRAIGRRRERSYDGYAAALHDLNAHVLAASDDLQFLFTIASEERSALSVWNVRENRITARIPIDATDWVGPAPNSSSHPNTDRRAPLAVAVARDGRTVVGVYALRQTRARTVARWRLDARGRCAGRCLPELFSFAQPHGTGAWTESSTLAYDWRVRRLRMTNADAALYFEPGAPPQRLNLARRTAAPFASLAQRARDCSFIVHGPPPDESSFDRMNFLKNNDPVWIDDAAQTAAHLSYATTQLSFYSTALGRETARVQLPKDACFVDCRVDVLFLDGGQRALVASLGHIDGIVDLQTCRFDPWPAKEAGFGVSGFRLAADGIHAAAIANDGVVLYSIPSRRIIARIPFLGALSVFEDGAAADGFLVADSYGITPMRSDGTRGTAIPGFWQAEIETPVQRGAESVDVLDPRTHRVTSIQWYGGRIRAARISLDTQWLAILHENAVLVQPAEAGGIGETRLLPIAGMAQSAVFSPDSATIAAIGTAELRVWRLRSAQPIGHPIALTEPRQILAVANDGRVVWSDDSGHVTRTDPRTGASSRIAAISWPRSAMQSDGQSVVLGDDGSLWRMDATSLPHKLAVAPFLEDKTLKAVTADGRILYVDDHSSDYFFDVPHRTAQAFLSQSTGPAAFSPAGRLAVAVGKSEIQLWDPMRMPRVAVYTGDWDGLHAVWFERGTGDLRAVDNNGRLHRWSLQRHDDADYARACLALRAAHARLELTDEEVASTQLLHPEDRAPCLRVGPLSADYYVDVARRLTGGATVSSDCAKERDSSSVRRCRSRFEERWHRLEVLARSR